VLALNPVLQGAPKHAVELKRQLAHVGQHVLLNLGARDLAHHVVVHVHWQVARALAVQRKALGGQPAQVLGPVEHQHGRAASLAAAPRLTGYHIPKRIQAQLLHLVHGQHGGAQRGGGQCARGAG
jgi:hypothetical protein